MQNREQQSSSSLGRNVSLGTPRKLTPTGSHPLTTSSNMPDSRTLLTNLNLNHIVENGFPASPLCSAYSSSLSALAIGTACGEVRLVGKENVQFLFNLRQFINAQIQQDSAANVSINLELSDEDANITHIAFLADSTACCRIACIVNYAHIVILELLSDSRDLDLHSFYGQRLEILASQLNACTAASAPPTHLPYDQKSISAVDITCFQAEEQSQTLYIGGSNSALYSAKTKSTRPDNKNSSRPASPESSTKIDLAPCELVCQFESGYGSVEDFEILGHFAFVVCRTALLVVDLSSSSTDDGAKVITSIPSPHNPYTSLTCYNGISKVAVSHFDGKMEIYQYLATWTQDIPQKMQVDLELEKKFHPWREPHFKNYENKAVNRVLSEGSWLVYEGGIPKHDDIDYDDMYVISATSILDQSNLNTLQKRRSHHSFYLPSKVINFHIVREHYLVVVTEQELVAYDLTSREEIVPPYMQALHCSAITELKGGILPKAERDRGSRGEGMKVKIAKRWPILGGSTNKEVEGASIDSDSGLSSEIVLTGHANGNVKVWNADQKHVSLMTELQTAPYFQECDIDVFSDDASTNNRYAHVENLNILPMGKFDPYADDERFQISRVAIDDGIIVTGGNGGQVFIFQSSTNYFSPKRPHYEKIDLFEKDHNSSRPENFRATQKPLTFSGFRGKSSSPKQSFLNSSFNATAMLQILPSARISCLAISKEFATVLIGTAYGFVIWDYRRSTVVFSRCTMTREAAELASEFSVPFGRSMRGFSRSLRASLRSIRASLRRRSRRPSGAGPPKTTMRTPRRDTNQLKPWAGTMVRKVEQTSKSTQSTNSVFAGVVRCAYFTHANLTSADYVTPCALVGTQGGAVYILPMSVPEYAKRGEAPVTITQPKCIQMQHKAPIVGIQTNKITAAKPTGTPKKTTPVPLLTICSEQQIKTFSLPRLKPQRKLKITAFEGLKIKTVEWLTSGILAGVLNNGAVRIFKVNNVSGSIAAEYDYNVVLQDNLAAINSMTLLKTGALFYRSSTSQIDRYRFQFANDVGNGLAVRSVGNNNGRSVCRLTTGENELTASAATTKVSAVGTALSYETRIREHVTEESTITQDEVSSF